MDCPSAELLARMPLAEAVLWLWRWIADEEHLESLFDRYRGRCYEKVISFPTMVQLIADALLEHGGSGNQSFRRAREEKVLEASLQAAYGKLRRLPIALSMALLTESSDRLRTVFPENVRRPGGQTFKEIAWRERRDVGRPGFGGVGVRHGLDRGDARRSGWRCQRRAFRAGPAA